MCNVHCTSIIYSCMMNMINSLKEEGSKYNSLYILVICDHRKKYTGLPTRYQVAMIGIAAPNNNNIFFF